MYIPETAKTQIAFSVYTASTSSVATRGASISVDDFKAQGIGVFAFHQEAKSNGVAVNYNHNMGEPEFMYNQHVTTVDGTTWTYTPTKYWPNNENDQLSFFAYAPYDYKTSWDEDMAITCNLEGTHFQKTFTIYPEATDEKDYLWTDPVLNQKKGAVDRKIQFDFSHVCARLGFKIGVCEDAPANAADATPTVWTDPDTYIRVNSITLRRAYTTLSLLYLYDKDETTGVETASRNWTKSGSQAVTLTANDIESVSEMQNNIVNTTTWATVPATDGYKKLNKDNAYMFLAPQKADDQDIEFTLDYDYVTTNLKGSGTTTVHRTYTHKLSDMTNMTNGLEAGKAYTIKYLIGTGYIHVSAVETDWDNNNVNISVE